MPMIAVGIILVIVAPVMGAMESGFEWVYFGVGALCVAIGVAAEVTR